jgi:hypothetical protein
MIVVGCFLHKVNSGPKQGKGSSAPSVPISQGNTDAQAAHYHKIQVHPYPGKWLQPIEPNKIKGEFRVYEISFYPTRGNGTKALKTYQNAKKYPEN